MAATFAFDTFLPAINSGENFLKLRDTSGNIRYKVYNNTVSSMFVTLDTVTIKTEADSKSLLLKFQTNTEAQNALVKLQSTLNAIKQNFQITKDSKFSDVSFEIYNDIAPENAIKFDLNNLTSSKTLTIGQGNVIQTDVEVNSFHNTVTQYRFFEHFLAPHNLIQGSYTTATIKPRANETGHFGILEMTLNAPATDAYLWSAVNAFQLNDTCKFSINFRITNVADVNDNYRIAIGFFNQNNITNITRLIIRI